jgi:1-acyl-sn-glycerol-3-phosphate acyltransferase
VWRLRGRTRDTVRLRVIALSLASGLTISFAAAALIPVASVSLFRARRLHAAVAARVARLVLRIWSIRIVVHQDLDRVFPRSQTIYVSNHSSTLDLFVLIALALPNTRFFMSGFLRKYPPLGIIAHLMGTFFTVPQSRQAERVRIFQRAARVLRQTGESVYLSPEGERIATGEIGHFNKGAFHLATALKAPIVPLYFQIPRDIDPGLGFDARPGTVHVHVMPAIDTSGWRIEQLHEHKERVRDMFIRWHRCSAARGENPTALGASTDSHHGLRGVHDVESTGASGIHTTEPAG